MYEGIASGDDVFKLSSYTAPHLSRPTFKEATSNEFEKTHVGAFFGPSWSTHWIKVELRVPSDLQKKDHLEFHWDAHNEGLIWTEDGEPIQGLTGNGDRVEWIIPPAFRDGQLHTIYIEMACNGMFGTGPSEIAPPDPNKYFQLTQCEIVAVNLEARGLYIDFWVLGDAAREFSEDSWEEHEALQLANKIMDCFFAGEGNQDSILECRKLAREYLGDVDSAKVYSKDEDILVYGIGHCHIDTCWLWPWAETKRKVARSWANQCNLMERYPELRFCCSQAQQYQWLEKLYPQLYDRVKTKVKEGKFQPLGGSWVEHDTNLPSGESLVRQFLYGQRFFESHFGERSRTFWLPDTFGYSSQIPQLSRLAGMNRFFTQKLSWNNINDFPHTTFNWVALDGSQVLCHMAPDNSYTAEANFGDVKRSLTQNKSMDQDPRGLLVFGKGDGGGGPTWEQIEKLRRCRGMSNTVGKLPKVQLGQSVDDYFDKLEEKAANGTEFVTWYGELYFELHRGTYTTQANTKWNNRKSEIMLHDLELVATMATLKNKSYKYPKAKIDEMWEGVLLCQFHDLIPGSSIEMCYRDSDKLYEKVFSTGKDLIEKAIDVLDPGNRRENGILQALNTLPWPRSDMIEPKAGNLDNAQESIEETDAHGVASLVTFQKRKTEATIKPIGEQSWVLGNGDFQVQIENGSITSIIDLNERREIVPKGRKANQLVIFDDKPLYWQAWDVEVYHLRSRKELSATSSEVLETGPTRVSVGTLTQISEKSWVKTKISLLASDGKNPSYVEMSSEVEWRETMKFLKVEFPVDIKNTEASYETQYGITRRPTHYNTSWDMARFEVCCHKWADLSEYGYGVSILNDSKYGFAVAGNVMRLSLLKASTAPDAHADMGKCSNFHFPPQSLLVCSPKCPGRHHIRYAILPHSGPVDHRIVRTARNFNHPLNVHRISQSAYPEITKLFRSISLHGSPALILDTIKRGEDDEDVSRGGLPKRQGRSIILRIYESLGGRACGRISLSDWLGVKRVCRTNLLEDDGDECELQDGQHVDIELRAFEVVTYRLQL